MIYLFANNMSNTRSKMDEANEKRRLEACQHSASTRPGMDFSIFSIDRAIQRAVEQKKPFHKQHKASTYIRAKTIEAAEAAAATRIAA
jgi:hypothetical protein